MLDFEDTSRTWGRTSNGPGLDVRLWLRLRLRLILCDTATARFGL